MFDFDFDNATFIQRKRDDQVIVFQSHEAAIAFIEDDDNKRDTFKFVDVTFHFTINI